MGLKLIVSEVSESSHADSGAQPVANSPAGVSRRQWLTTLGTGLLSACKASKESGYFGYALIADQAEMSISVVDLTSFRLANTIPIGAPPTAIVSAGQTASASRIMAYVLTPADGTVHLIDADLKRVTGQRLSDRLNEIRLVPGLSSLVAVSESGRELIQADSKSLRVLRRYTLPFAPTALDISSSGLAAVADGPHGQLALIDLATGRRNQASLQGPLGALRFRADGKLLLAANLAGRSILALDVPTLQTVAELPLAMQPENLCFNADQGQLFVSGAGMDGVAVIFPYNTLEVDQTLLAGHAPGPMACSETPAYLFVASSIASSVCVLNIDTRKQLGLVDVGGKPTFVATTPDSRYTLILNESSGDMAVIHIPAIRTSYTANRLKNGTALFTVLNVGTRPVHAAIVPRFA